MTELYTKIYTREELNHLPLGAAIIERLTDEDVANGWAAPLVQKVAAGNLRGHDLWYTPGVTRDIFTEEIALPATLIYLPGDEND